MSMVMMLWTSGDEGVRRVHVNCVLLGVVAKILQLEP